MNSSNYPMYWGGVSIPGMVSTHPHPRPREQTHTHENITFSQLRVWAVNSIDAELFPRSRIVLRQLPTTLGVTILINRNNPHLTVKWSFT